jgi:hypothetical protein
MQVDQTEKSADDSEKTHGDTPCPTCVRLTEALRVNLVELDALGALVELDRMHQRRALGLLSDFLGFEARVRELLDDCVPRRPYQRPVLQRLGSADPARCFDFFGDVTRRRCELHAGHTGRCGLLP